MGFAISIIEENEQRSKSKHTVLHRFKLFISLRQAFVGAMVDDAECQAPQSTVEVSSSGQRNLALVCEPRYLTAHIY